MIWILGIIAIENKTSLKNIFSYLGIMLILVKKINIELINIVFRNYKFKIFIINTFRSFHNQHANI